MVDITIVESTCNFDCRKRQKDIAITEMFLNQFLSSKHITVQLKYYVMTNVKRK